MKIKNTYVGDLDDLEEKLELRDRSRLRKSTLKSNRLTLRNWIPYVGIYWSLKDPFYHSSNDAVTRNFVYHGFTLISTIMIGVGYAVDKVL